jgi:hypothetical protein
MGPGSPGFGGLAKCSCRLTLFNEAALDGGKIDGISVFSVQLNLLYAKTLAGNGNRLRQAALALCFEE